MINKIIAYSVKNKLIIGLFVLAIIGIGSYSVYTINLGAQPDITNNQVQIITVSENLSTEDVEQFVTYPVELAMSNLPGVKEVRSISRFGLSVVTIVFTDKMGTYLPRQLVNEMLIEVRDEIPKVFGSPIMGPITTGLGEIYQYTIRPQKGYENKYTLTELRSIQDWMIKRQMALTPGVVEVNSFGGCVKQYEVALDPTRLNALNIPMSIVFEALEKNNINTGGAYIEKQKMANFIRGEGLIHSLEDIRNIVVKTVNDVPILVRDIATVRYGHQVRYGAFTQDGKEAVGGMVLMLKGANQNKVVEVVKKKMEEIEKSLPNGLEIQPFLESSQLISRTTDTIKTNLMEGALIVIFVLILLLGSIRGGLIAASLIPLSLLFAFILMRVFGVWANLMSLGAIDFGIIVDGAVIIVEGTVFEIERRFKKRSSGLTKTSMDQVVVEAADQMMGSAFFGQVIILIVFIPILFLTGVEGKMFKPMALTFGFAVLGAIILCLTYVPMITSLMMRPSEKESWFRILEDKMHRMSVQLIERIHKGYHFLFVRCLKYKFSTIAVATILLLIAGYSFKRLGGEFIPSIDEGDIAMQVLLRPGSSLTETMETTKRIERIVTHNFPEVKTMVSRIGVADIPTDPMPMDIADSFIILEKDKDQWVSASSKEELMDKIKEKLKGVKGVNFVFSQPVELRFNELLTGVREDVAVKLYGSDLDVLSQKGEEIKSLIQTVPGADDVSLEATGGLPQINVIFNRDKIAQYGVNIEKLNNYITMAFAGEKAGVVFEGERRFDLVVRLEDPYRSSINDLKNLWIDLPNGHQIPLRELADIDFQSGPMQISRDNTSRRISVGVNVRDRDVESVVLDIQEKLTTQLKLPPGYYVEYGGAFENLQRAKARLGIVVPVALFLIFVMLYFALNSIIEAVMIYAAVPLAAVGGVFSLTLRGMPFSISAGVGFIVLFGVAVLNGLVLISRLNSLEKKGVVSVKKRIFMATGERMRPILLTALAAIMGFLPMAFSTGAGASVQRPLATVVIGGLISATILTLIVLPILYYIIKSSSRSFLQNFKKIPGTLVLIFTVLFSLFSASGLAQERDETRERRGGDQKGITIKEAVKMAVKASPRVKAADWQVEKQEALKKTAWDFGSTEIFTGGEELRSVSDRNKGVYTEFGINQTEIDLLGIAPRKKLKKEEVAAARAGSKVEILGVRRQVQKAWSKVYTARGKYKLFLELDSIFQNLKTAAQLQYETQAVSRLDYLAAINQVAEIALQKKQAYRDYQVGLQNFNSFFDEGSNYTVSSGIPEWILQPLLIVEDTLRSHPVLQQARQNLDIARANYEVERSAFFPKFNIEYGRQRIEGEGGYHSFQLGIKIPLIFTKELGAVQSAKINQQIAQEELRARKRTINTQYHELIQTYRKWLESWQFYKEEALPLAREQREAALFAFTEGALEYTAFLQRIRDAVTIQAKSWETMNNYLQTKYELEYFLNSSQSEK